MPSKAAWYRPGIWHRHLFWFTLASAASLLYPVSRGPRTTSKAETRDFKGRINSCLLLVLRTSKCFTDRGDQIFSRFRAEISEPIERHFSKCKREFLCKKMNEELPRFDLNDGERKIVRGKSPIKLHPRLMIKRRVWIRDKETHPHRCVSTTWNRGNCENRTCALFSLKFDREKQFCNRASDIDNRLRFSSIGHYRTYSLNLYRWMIYVCGIVYGNNWYDTGEKITSIRAYGNNWYDTDEKVTNIRAKRLCNFLGFETWKGGYPLNKVSGIVLWNLLRIYIYTL